MKGKLSKKSHKGQIRIEGLCPNCGRSNSIMFVDLYYTNEPNPFAIDMPMCQGCCYDEIRVRKINNRRYKVHEVQWDEYYENLSKYKDYDGDDDYTF